MNLRSLALAAVIAVTCAASPATSQHAQPARRVVSLIPSLTEVLFAVGAGPTVVGVSQYTDYPKAAKQLPIVASFASVDAERVVALHPDLVLGIEAQSQLVGDLTRARIPVVLLKDDSFDDIFVSLRRVAALTGHNGEERALERRLRAQTSSLRASVPKRARKPNVFVVLGTAPVFTVGNESYIARLIDLAGGVNAASDINAPYARYSAEALVARQPDLLVVDPEVHLEDVLGRPPWNALRAVQQHRVYTLPDAAILLRPGPRYNDGLAWLIATFAKVPT